MGRLFSRGWRSVNRHSLSLLGWRLSVVGAAVVVVVSRPRWLAVAAGVWVCVAVSAFVALWLSARLALMWSTYRLGQAAILDGFPHFGALHDGVVLDVRTPDGCLLRCNCVDLSLLAQHGLFEPAPGDGEWRNVLSLAPLGASLAINVRPVVLNAAGDEWTHIARVLEQSA